MPEQSPHSLKKIRVSKARVRDGLTSRWASIAFDQHRIVTCDLPLALGSLEDPDPGPDVHGSA
jgi:hypothetical protein